MEPRKQTSMHSTAMCWAAAEGDLETVRRLREEHGADVNAADYDKRTPLHIAVSDGQLEMVSYLLQCGANAEARDRWGRSSIDCAIETKNVAILRLLERETYSRSGTLSLFQDGKKVRSTSESEGMQRSQSSPAIASFFQAIQEGNTEEIKRSWLNGMAVNVADHLGRTSLHVAVENGQMGVVELLVSAGVNTTVLDTFGRSPISIALEKHYLVIAELLRSHQQNYLSSHQLHHSDDAHQIALAFQATKRGEIERLQQLVPAHVRPDVEDYDRRTLLHVASAEGHLPLVKYLVDCGANVNFLDRWGSSPLADAVDFAHNDVAKFLSANHATESGFRTTVAVEYIDKATLTEAFEYTLRLVTRTPWIMGQVHCPVLDDANHCMLMTHSTWQKNKQVLETVEATEGVASTASSTLSLKSAAEKHDRLHKYRKVASMVLIDPGQGHIGRVFSSQYPEWLDLSAAHQAQFFLLPHARLAGFQTTVALPMICKLSTVAVLSWYSTHAMREDPHEVQRIQRLVRSVTILASLRQELQSSKGKTGRLPRFQYCQTLDNAVTANGELTDTLVAHEDLLLGDTIPLALEWHLFDLVDTLATSMSSEDHAAVVPILRSLVKLLDNGLFDETVRHYEIQSHDSALKRVIEEANGVIRTKAALLAHVKYYLQYLYTVSPTEADLFTDVHELFRKVETLLSHRTAKDQPVQSDDNSTDARKIEETAETVATERASSPACVLCKYAVPGHIHPGREPIPATGVPAKAAPSSSPSSNLLSSNQLFGHAARPKSPVFRHLDQLLARLEGEYDAFERKAELADCCDKLLNPTVVTSSDVYDVIGAAHETASGGQTTVSTSSRNQLLDVIKEILHDASSVVSQHHLFAVHKHLFPASSHDAGIVRTEVAVGFASPRIYRVFMPADELQEALSLYIQTLNDTTRWAQRPLLCAYYAFAALVFYIHPFHDGNGRCARLLCNVIARKQGFPFVLQAADKTMQVVEFLQKAIVMAELLRQSRRQVRQTRGLSTRRENSSMWF